MSFHTVAFSQDVVTGSSYSAVAAVGDSIFAQSGNGFLVPYDLRLIAAYGGGTDMLRARINAPSLLRVGYPSIRPVFANTNGVPTTDPNFMTLLGSPLLLRGAEVVGIDAVHANVGTVRQVSFLWLADKLEPVPPGDSFWLRFTGALSLTTTPQYNIWQVLSPTYDQSIPSGTYAVIGLEFMSANALAARLVLPGAVFRPGVLAGGTAAASPRTYAGFYDGSFGTFGTFQTTSPPNIEIMVAGNSTAQEGYLRVVRIGDIGAASPPMPTGPMLPHSASPVMGPASATAGASGASLSSSGPYTKGR